MNTETASIEMPRYRSHKIVHALSILDVTRYSDGSAILRFARPDYAPLSVPSEYVAKHDPKAGGYYVIYSDGYQSWSPAEAFESGYTEISSGMNFGDAIAALKAGKRVARKGWNGKGMFLFLLPAATVPIANIHTEPLRSLAEANGGTIECLGSIRMKTADNKILTGWLASQTDILSEDWEIVS